ncbi:GGDEF domain-containing protein [Octadecabacter sp.]|nr:GGDEF domain-containing protein [Octadecabacter sp.]
MKLSHLPPTAMVLFWPRTRRQKVVSFLCWQGLFFATYLGLLWVFGQLDRAPLREDLFLSVLLCTPFISVTMILVNRHIRLSRKFQYLSERDTLTGLPNRRSFFCKANQKRDPDNRDLVIVVDIDHFKQVNDVHGHHKGDLCLQKVADYLMGWIRDEDLICRFGGEEFAVILSKTSVSVAQPIAQTVAQGQWFDLDGTHIKVAFSMGITRWLPDLSLDEALQQADKVLYEAKRSGRGQALVYDPAKELTTTAA